MTAWRAPVGVEPPPDLAMMRETAAIALADGEAGQRIALTMSGAGSGAGAGAGAFSDYAGLTTELVGHLHQLVPQVAELIPRRPTTVEQYCALACLGEARRKLSQEAGPTPSDQAAHARRLARVLVALSAHWETLSRPPVSP
ncbi:DUF6415 family natural product biosynthesis protein [Streptomyces sp. NPDC005840]|uniref:DUF6415 family natural product biosynthesis protein n=1 Tax=Streptomyces sp. NPDC005840 TaxID=3157072 RepID=UPI0033FD3A56